MKNKTLLSRIFLMIGVWTLLLIGADPVYAADNLPDLSKKGSISIMLQDKKNHKVMSDGEMTLYQVADVVLKDGELSYQYVNGFENCGIELGNLDDSALAEKLENRLSKTAVGTTQAVDANGTVKYSDLSAGLYLFVQTGESKTYEKISSFIVSMPLNMNGSWVYDVDASPKVETITDRTPDTEETSDVPPETEKPDHPGKKLPQTGQLKWPIPVLSIAGVVIFSIGWMMRKEDKSE